MEDPPLEDSKSPGQVGLESCTKNYFILQEDGHSDWVSCVQFSPNPNTPIIVSCGWDKIVKVSLFHLRDSIN